MAKLNKIISIDEKPKLPEIITKIQPLFNYNLVAYQLSEKQARYAYPKYKDGQINWTDDERAQIPELNVDLDFDQLVTEQDATFKIVTIARLQNVKVYESELIASSADSQIHHIKNGATLYNRKDFGDESLAGFKVHIDYYNDIVYSLVDSYSISAYNHPETN